MGDYALAHYSGRLAIPALSPALSDPFLKVIDRAPRSGISSLDGAMHELAQALQGTNVSATKHAVGNVVAACVKLKFWQNYELVG